MGLVRGWAKFNIVYYRFCSNRRLGWTGVGG